MARELSGKSPLFVTRSLRACRVWIVLKSLSAIYREHG